MIPLGDSIRARRTPFVTYLLIGLNVFFFLIELAQGRELQLFLLRWGAVPARLQAWPDHPGILVTLVTSMFLHGGWLHLISNMVYLWIFGDNVEDRLGHMRYLVFYMLSGIIAGLVQVWASPGSQIPGVGASGAIAGVLGAYLVFFPAARVLVGIPLFLWLEVFAMPAVFVLGFWFITQFFNGMFALAFTRTVYAGGVAWWAHIGGFVAGMILGPLLRAGQREPRWPRYTYYYR
ncbi:MAG: rhomboid family intramembrane serine protease [Chloroflexi bacterium]|nr:MAG: rhomboid family intramembrane serine protease [Chloroflexota bacterium]